MFSDWHISSSETMTDAKAVAARDDIIAVVVCDNLLTAGQFASLDAEKQCARVDGLWHGGIADL